MTARVEYWDASLTNPRWVEARIEYGTGNYSNACLSVNITERLDSASKAIIRLSNHKWDDNLADHGPFTNEFIDFQRIRVLDDAVNVVLFSGRIYGIVAQNDNQFGKVVELTCWNLLRELQDYDTSHLDTDIVYGSGDGQFRVGSELIETLIASGFTHKSSIEIPSSSIDLSDTGGSTAANDGNKFRASAVVFNQGMKEKYNFSKGGAKNALAHVSAIARQEPHSNATNESSFGYDYFLDSRFDRSTDFTTSTSATLRGDSFNYFKRGTQPASVSAGGATGADWRGLKISYPSASFTEAGNHVQMMHDSQFEYPKEQLFTSAIFIFDAGTKLSKTYNSTDNEWNFDAWEAVGHALDLENVPINISNPHNGRFIAEVLTGGTFTGASTGGSVAGKFLYEGRPFHPEFRNAGTENANDAAQSVYHQHTHSSTNSDHSTANHSGSAHWHKVGRVQYQDTLTGVGMVLLSHDDEDQLKTFDKICNDASPTTSFASFDTTSAIYTFTPKLHRLISKFDLKRPYVVKVEGANNIDNLRQEAANALSKSAFPQITGRFRTLRAPYYYIDLTCGDSGDENVITPTHINGAAVSTTLNLLTHGVKRGMTIAHIDTEGNQDAWGWITSLSTYDSAVTGGSIAITAPIRAAVADSESAAVPTYANASWDDVTGSIRVYIPVRPGHYTYTKNESQNIDGYHFIDEVLYTELQGAVGTTYKTFGTNATTGAYEGPHKHKLPQILVEIDDTAKSIGSLSDIPHGILPWTFQQTSTTDHTARFTISSRTAVSWSGGILSVGSIYQYKIKAGSMTLDKDDTSDQADSKPIEYIISFDPDQTPDNNGLYSIVFTKRKEYIDDVDKLRLGWARAGATASDPAVLEIGGNTVVGDLSMKSIGSALMHRGAQGFTSEMTIVRRDPAAYNTCQWEDFRITFHDGTHLDVDGGNITLSASESERSTYWMYVTIPETGDGTLSFGASAASAIGDAKLNVGMAIVEIDDANSSNYIMPSIFPINAKDPVVSAGLVQANHLSAITGTLGTINSGTIKLSDNITGGINLTKQGSSGSYTETDDLRALWNYGRGIYISPAGIWGIGNSTKNIDGLTKYVAEWMCGSGISTSGDNKADNKGYIMAGAYPAGTLSSTDAARQPTIRIGAEGIQVGAQNQTGTLQQSSHGISHFGNAPNHPSIGVLGLKGVNPDSMRPPNTLSAQLTYSTMVESGSTLKNGLLRFQDQIPSGDSTKFTGYWGSGIAWSSALDNNFGSNITARAGVTFQHKNQGHVSDAFHYASHSSGTPTRGRLEFISYSMDDDNSTAGENQATDFYVGTKGGSNPLPLWQFAVDTDYTAKALKRIGSLELASGANITQQSSSNIIIQPPTTDIAYTLTLPSAAPTASGQTLLTSGSGASQTLTWGAGSGGSGDIEGVTAGTGLSGGGTSGTVTLTNTGVLTIVAGSNISISGATGAVTITGTNTWRDIDDTPVNGVTTESISSNWAYDHAADATAHSIASQIDADVAAHTANASAHAHPDPVILGSGSESAPTYTFSGDTDTGMYRIDDHGIGFSSGGDKRVQFDSWVQVYDNSGSFKFYVIASSGSGRFYGNLTIDGALSKGSGSFLIDHPLDKPNKDLYHGFVEAPRYDLIYRGIATLSSGTATVDIDTSSNMTSGTFVALTQNSEVWLQNKTGWTALKGSVSGATLTITAQDASATDTVAWMVIAERADSFIVNSDTTDSDGHLIPERNKPDQTDDQKDHGETSGTKGYPRHS